MFRFWILISQLVIKSKVSDFYFGCFSFPLFWKSDVERGNGRLEQNSAFNNWLIDSSFYGNTQWGRPCLINAAYMFVWCVFALIVKWAHATQTNKQTNSVFSTRLRRYNIKLHNLSCVFILMLINFYTSHIGFWFQFKMFDNAVQQA